MRTELRWIGLSLCLAVVTLSLFGVVLAQNEGADEHFVYLPLIFKPLPPTDLILTQKSAPNPYVAGAPITYTVTLTNAGPTTLSEAALTTLLPQAVLSSTYTTTIGTYRPLSGTWLSLTLGAGDVALLQISGTVSETFTGTLMSTAVVTPVGAREEDAMDNAAFDVNPTPLLNPGFEGLTEPGGTTHETHSGATWDNIFVPEGWVIWWREDGQTIDGVPYGRPEATTISREDPRYIDPVLRIHGETWAAKLFTVGYAHDAGYYQTLEGLPTGATVTFSAYAHAWCSNNDDATQSEGAHSCWFNVGLDPDGKTDPWSDDVQWSDNYYIFDVYDRVGPISATVGSAGRVTVFLRSRAKWGYKHNDVYWDDASLTIRP